MANLTDETRATLQRVAALIKAGQRAEARSQLVAVLKADPRCAPAWHFTGIGAGCFGLGSPDQQIADLNKQCPSDWYINEGRNTRTSQGLTVEYAFPTRSLYRSYFS